MRVPTASLHHTTPLHNTDSTEPVGMQRLHGPRSSPRALWRFVHTEEVTGWTHYRPPLNPLRCKGLLLVDLVRQTEERQRPCVGQHTCHTRRPKSRSASTTPKSTIVSIASDAATDRHRASRSRASAPARCHVPPVAVSAYLRGLRTGTRPCVPGLHSQCRFRS